MKIKNKIAFQIDWPDELNLKRDTSVLLMKEFLSRGFDVFYYHPTEISMLGGEVFAKLRKFYNDDFIDWKNKETSLSSLFDCIGVFIRQNPPFDMTYVTSTYLLDVVKKHGVVVINDPTTVRNYSEKLFAVEFSQFHPITLISPNFKEVEQFYNANENIVLKPLYGYGGDGVFVIKKGDKNLLSAFNTLKLAYDGLPIIAQKYIPDVKYGDKRVLLLNGEFLGVVNRLQPEHMSMSNTRYTGMYEACKLSDNDYKIISTLSPVLKSLNITLAGIDIIGNFLTEINITSPTGVALINELDNKRYEVEIVNFIQDNLFKV